MNPIDTAKGAVNFFAKAKTGQIDPVGGVVDYAKERYGSVDRFQSALMQDPVGVLGDISMVGAAGAIPKLGHLSKLGYLDPLGAVGGGAQQGAKWLGGKTQKMYANAMGLPDDPNRLQIAQTGLENEATRDLASRQKVHGRTKELGREVGAMLEPHKNKRLGLENVQEELNDVGKRMLRRGNPEWEKNLRQINKVERGV
jgi:hypothetical protein